MAYLLSLLKSKSSAKVSTQDAAEELCYYINDTQDAQVIRVISGVRCELERIVFPGERILFTAFLHSYLEVYSSMNLVMGARFNRVACSSLRVHAQQAGRSH